MYIFPRLLLNYYLVTYQNKIIIKRKGKHNYLIKILVCSEISVFMPNTHSIFGAVADIAVGLLISTTSFEIDF